MSGCLPACFLFQILGGTFSACFIILTFLPHFHFCFHMHCHLCTASSFTQPLLVGTHTTVCWYLQMPLPHFILLKQIYSAELISSVRTVIVWQFLHILGHLLTSEFTGRNCHHDIYEVKALFKTCANITYLKMHKHMDRMFAMLCHHQRNIFFFFLLKPSCVHSAFVTSLLVLSTPSCILSKLACITTHSLVCNSIYWY